MLPCASSRRWRPLIQSPTSNASALSKPSPCPSPVGGRGGLLWRRLLWGALLLRRGRPWPRRPGDRQVLVLPLPVGDYCSQEQRDDGHEVKVPLRSQELVHIKLTEYVSNLGENNIKIIMITYT